MRESKHETYLRKHVEARGGLFEKCTPPPKNRPDRMATWPGGYIDLIEMKATGKKPCDGQLRDHARRAELGVAVWVLSSIEECDKYLAFCEWRRSDSGPPDGEMPNLSYWMSNFAA